MTSEPPQQPAKPASRPRWRRRLLRALVWLLLLPPVLLALVGLLIYLPPVQDLLRGRAIGYLEQRIGTPVRLGHFALRYPIGVGLEELLVIDQQGDTLLYAGEVKAHLGLRALLNGRIELGGTELSHVRACIVQRPDSTFNFNYILRAFAGDDTLDVPTNDSTSSTSFSMSGVRLSDVRFDLLLMPSGTDLAVRLGALDVEMEEMDAGALRFHVDAITLADARIDLRSAPGPPVPDPYPQVLNPFGGLDIRLRGLGLRNVAFSSANTTTGDSLWLELEQGDVRTDSIALDLQRIRLASVGVDGIRFGLLTHAATASSDTGGVAPPVWLDQHDGFRYWTRGLDVGVRELTLTHGDLQVHNGAISASQRLLDPAHVVFTAIGARATDIVFTDDRLSAHLEELAAIGANGSALRAAVRLDASPSVVRVEEGVFALDDGEVRLSVVAAPGDPSNAYRAPMEVPLRGTLSSTVDLAKLPVLLRDLGVVPPDRLSANEVWHTALAYSGTLRRTDTLRVDIVGDRGTAVHLTADAQDNAALPRGPFHVDVRDIAMGSGLRAIVGAYMPASVPVPERFGGSTQLSGTGDALTAQVDISSDLGDVSGSMDAAGLRGRMPDVLNADLEIRDLDAHRFTGDTSLGKVSAHVIAEGRMLNTPARSGRISVEPSRLTYNGQDLSSAQLRANVQGDSIHAAVTSSATHLAMDLRTDLRWPPGSDTVSGALGLRVQRLGLKELGWYEHPLNVQGEWHGTGVFSTDGFADVTVEGDSVSLSNAERSFRFEEFAARGHLSRDSTMLRLDSDGLVAAFSSNTPVDSLLPRAQEKLLSFFRSDSTFTDEPGRRMDLHVALPRSEWLTGLVLPDLKAVELRECTGHYDSDADELSMLIDLPVLRYKGLSLSNLSLDVDAQGNDLQAAAHVDSARYNAFRLDGLALTAASGPGVLRTELRITEGEGAPTYVVPVEFHRPGGELAMHLPEGLVLDSVPWTVDALNTLRFTEAGPVAEHFILSSGPQRAEVSTSTNSTSVRLDHFRIGNLMNVISTTDTTELAGGEISGDLSIPLNATENLHADLRVDDMTVTGHPLGDLVIKAQGSTTDRYEAEFRFENGPNTLDGNLHYDGAAPGAPFDTHADIGLVDMSFLEPFTGRFVYELSGGLKGTVEWSSSAAGKRLDGDLTFSNTTLGVVQTGARYQLRNERVLADRTGFTFDHFTVLDSLGNAIVLDGRVFTEDLISMRFDLGLQTDSFQLLGSDKGKKQLFYGDLFTSADVHITGTDRAPVVKGDLGILPGTDLSLVLPGSEVKLVQSEGIVEFTTDLEGTDSTHAATDQERLRDSLRAQLPEVDLDLQLRVDDKALFAMVLDPTTGDRATFQGEGDLHFRYTPDHQMLLRGPFILSKGGYTLEFYGLVKKRFDLLPGSQVLWEGDPLDARMDVHARYISQSAAYPLVANATGELSETERNRLATRMPFEVVINIGGGMKKPDISFGIDLPEQYRNSYPKVDQELDRLADKSKDEERNRQVFGLLVFDSFIQDDAAGGTPSSGLVTSAARNSVNGILTEQLNKATGSLVKGVDVQLGVSTVDQVQGASTYQQTSLDYKVSKSFMDERLSFEVGGSVAVDEKGSAASSVSNQRAAQYAILYELTDDGRYRLRGFHQSAFDLYDGDITESGVSIIFTHDFEENERARERAREVVRKRQAEERERRKSMRGKRTGEAPAPTPEPHGP